MGKYSQVLRVCDLGCPQHVGKVAAPDAAVRTVRLDNSQRGVVQVGTGIADLGAGADEVDFRVEIRVARQTQYLTQGFFVLRTWFEIHAMIEADGQLRECPQQFLCAGNPGR